MSNNPNEPDLRTTPQPYRRPTPSWQIWAALIAVLVVGGFALSQWGGAPGTDHITTSSTTTDTQPLAPASPKTPAPALAPPTAAPVNPAPAN
jgi:hypothetical protein